jgi:hypothetical protein
MKCVYPFKFASTANKTRRRTDNFGRQQCKSGDGLELTVTSPNKWLLNWVEIFERLEQPLAATLQYLLPESVFSLTSLYFSNPKFYMPDDATPVYTLSIYKGMVVTNIPLFFQGCTLYSI